MNKHIVKHIVKSGLMNKHIVKYIVPLCFKPIFHFRCPVPVRVRTNEQTYRETYREQTSRETYRETRRIDSLRTGVPLYNVYCPFVELG